MFESFEGSLSPETSIGTKHLREFSAINIIRKLPGSGRFHLPGLRVRVSKGSSFHAAFYLDRGVFSGRQWARNDNEGTSRSSEMGKKRVSSRLLVGRMPIERIA